MKRIGFVGLGEMGLPMARNVHARGFEVRGYDTRAEAQRAFRETGGRVAASAEEAAQEADAVIVMVRTPAQAEEVVLGDGGVLEHAPRGTLLAVMSTIGVACMRRLGAGALRARHRGQCGRGQEHDRPHPASAPVAMARSSPSSPKPAG